ncbi:hypothetical protein GQ600_1169 [Phytophthora cactorum]|nr:hypothetical protein GQ600_1169 [Phytophthora cactorum]
MTSYPSSLGDQGPWWTKLPPPFRPMAYSQSYSSRILPRGCLRAQCSELEGEAMGSSTDQAPIATHSLSVAPSDHARLSTAPGLHDLPLGYAHCPIGGLGGHGSAPFDTTSAPLQPATAFNLAEFARRTPPSRPSLLRSALSGREGGQAIRPFRGASSLSAFAATQSPTLAVPALPTPSRHRPLHRCFPARRGCQRTQGRYFPLLSHQLAAYRLFQDPNAETGRYFSPMAFVLRVREIDCVGFDAPPAVLMVLYSERLGSRGLTMMHV